MKPVIERHLKEIDAVVTNALMEIARLSGAVIDSKRAEAYYKESVLPHLRLQVERWLAAVSSDQPTVDDAATSEIGAQSAADGAQSHEERLLRILRRQQDSDDVERIIADIKSGTPVTDLVKKLLAVYCHYYNHPSDRIATALEEYLLHHEGLNVILNHPQIRYPERSALQFAKVKVYYARTKLNPAELAKLEVARLEEHPEEGMILLELCPQIILNGRMFNRGKVVVS